MVSDHAKRHLIVPSHPTLSALMLANRATFFYERVKLGYGDASADSQRCPSFQSPARLFSGGSRKEGRRGRLPRARSMLRLRSVQAEGLPFLQRRFGDHATGRPGRHARTLQPKRFSEIGRAHV